MKEFLMVLLLAGLPYYVFFEKKFSEKFFYVSFFLILVGLSLLWFFNLQCNYVCIFIALATSIFTTYKAIKTTNLYKLSYYFLFINSPVYFLFSIKYSVYFIISLLITSLGLFLIGKYYERNYGSPNFYGIGGLALQAPIAGLFLRIYLITLALYPPFPNAVLLFNSMLKSELDIVWYTVVVVFFFGNFFVAMRILTNTVFGKPNKNVFYIDFNVREKLIHTLLNITLLVIGIYGLKEVLQ